MSEKLNPREAAEKLGVTVQTIRVWMQLGKLSYTKIGGRYFINPSDLDLMVVPHNATSINI